MRADAIGDAISLTVGDTYAPVVDSQHLGADLRHHGLEALAERRAAGDELDRARGVDLDPHAIRGAQATLLHEHRKPGADGFSGGATSRQRSPELVPIERYQELVEQPDIVAGIVFDLLAQRLERPVIGHLVRRDG